MRKAPLAIAVLALSIGCSQIPTGDATNPFPGTWNGGGADSGTAFTFDALLNFTYTYDAGLSLKSGTYSYTAQDLSLVFVSPDPDPAVGVDRVGYSGPYAFSADGRRLSIYLYPDLTKQ